MTSRRYQDLPKGRRKSYVMRIDNPKPFVLSWIITQSKAKAQKGASTRISEKGCKKPFII